MGFAREDADRVVVIDDGQFHGDRNPRSISFRTRPRTDEELPAMIL
jgi:ABC-type polar amino acid transport system ATPase subunit